MASSYTFLDVRVDNVTMNQTVAGISDAIKQKRPYSVVTVNPELVMAARDNATFKQFIKDADVVTPDGIGLIIIGRLTGRRLYERVTGVDLCSRLAKEAAMHGWSIYLLGAGAGIAKQAAKNLRDTRPDLVIVGANSADPDDLLANDIIIDIKKMKPDILLVAYGSPTQELWIKKHRKQIGNIVTIGVGGSFDFIAGSAKRAPKLVQKIGLEWLWRLIMQPSRLRRMLALPKFAILSLFE